MKIRWKQRNFTLVFIPEANRRIRQARIPRCTLYVIPMSLLALILAITLWLYDAKINYTHLIQSLTHQLADEKEESTQLAADKNRTIESLQNEIIGLTEQAEEVRGKLDELKKLEVEVRKISNLTDPSSDGISMMYDTIGPPPAPYGLGGERIAADDERITQLAAQTQTSFKSLKSDIADLSVTLSEISEDLKNQQHLLNITPSIWPANSTHISSGFGIRRDPFTFRPAFHSGIDIAAETGDAVYASAEGVVAYKGRDQLHGNHIIIDHSNGIRTAYLHLSKILVRTGETVVKGETIGLVGSTGRSTGPHLHYEVYKNGKQINPTPYLSQKEGR